MSTLLGFDYGLRKIGVAVGQTVTGSATPLATLKSRGERPDWPGIEALVREWQPCAAVIGLPYRMDDTEESWTPLVRRFARQIEGRFRIPTHLVDERLTTMEARRLLAEHHGLRPGRRPPERTREDALAAALILETWLGEHARGPSRVRESD